MSLDFSEIKEEASGILGGAMGVGIPVALTRLGIYGIEQLIGADMPELHAWSLSMVPQLIPIRTKSSLLKRPLAYYEAMTGYFLGKALYFSSIRSEDASEVRTPKAWNDTAPYDQFTLTSRPEKSYRIFDQNTDPKQRTH